MTAHIDKYVGDWGHYSLPVRGKIAAATLEISVTVLIKLRINLPLDIRKGL